jgi:5'(3')-deoxyribonucleotidase
MRIALDLDMTLNNMAYTWMTWIQKNIDEYANLSKVRYFGYLLDAYGEDADSYWKNPAAYDEIRPLNGAVYFVEQLRMEHDVFILTHTPEGQKSEVKDAWIKDYFGDIQVVHSQAKFLHTKDAMLIDDHPTHIQKHVLHNKSGRGVVFNHQGHYGWARQLTSHERVDEAKTYDQLRTIINHFAKG